MAKKKYSERKSTESTKSKKKKQCKKTVKIGDVNIRKKRSEKCYSVEDMQAALNALGEGQTLRQATKAFGVPKSTLLLKWKNVVPLEYNKGPMTVLSFNDEKEIEQWILFCAEADFPVTKSKLLDCVQTFVGKKKTPFKNNRPGPHWYKAFMKRHPILSQRIAQNLTSTRASVTEEDLRNWFKKVKLNLENKQLFNIEADRVFNLDESAFMLVPKDNKVIKAKGARAPYQIVSGNEKATLTVLFTISASGRMPPPMILYDLKTAPRKNILNQIPKDWGVGNTERGWMTAESFYKYIENVFLKWLKENNYIFPVILYVNGHSSHMTLPLLRLCKQNQIEIIVLYPNATHIIQPLDVAIFHPLKDAYRKVLRQWRIDNNVVNFQKSMFPPVLKLALDSCDLTSATINGFRACGLYPFNADAVNYNVLSKKSKQKTSSDEPVSTSKPVTSDATVFLQVFERDFISPVTLKAFKEVELDVAWTGDLKYYKLFECWRKLRNRCTESEVEMSEGTLTETLTTGGSQELDVEMSEVPVRSPNVTATEPSTAEGLEELFALERSAEENIEISYENHGSTIINLDDIEFEGTNFGVEFPVSEIDLTDESENQVTAAIIEVIPDDTNNRDSLVSVDSTSLQDHTHSFHTSDKSEISMDTIENQNNDELDDTNDSTVLNDSNQEVGCGVLNDDKQEVGCASDSNSFPSTSEEILNLSSVDTSNKDILDLTSMTKDRTDFSNIFSATTCTSDSAENQNNTSNAVGTMSTLPEAKNDSCNISITEESNSSICSDQSDNKTQLSPTFKDSFPIPTFAYKKKKKINSESSTNVALVEDLLEILQKKEAEKEEKKQQILLNKKEREKARILKEKELNIIKSFNENKKKKLQEKKNIKQKIQTLKKLMKVKEHKENEAKFIEQLQQLSTQLTEIENSIISQDMELLQTKIKIKQEKL